ncbi:MAG: hypothetical protein ISS49_04500, partial [Anaerolineae bacterium]|nr:hypothetical protein [Anaerolineae bacterium]
NPQVTDDVYPDGITTTGYYAFFTPPGFYYIDVEGIDGYQHWRSPVVQVITEIVHVNVPYTPWPEEDVYTVTITADGPDSATITVPVGSAVEWTSALRDGDTITDLMTWSENPILRPLSGLDPLEDTRGFDAGYLEPGRVYRREFARSGVYAYTDAAGHGGVVVVEAALDEVIIAGPPTTTVGIPATFTATVEPPTATLPITYTWRVSESVSQRVITHTGGLSDTAVFTWTVVGPQVVTVTAVNECGDGVSATHTITVTAEATGWYIYLPLVVRELEGLVLSGAEGLVARGYGQGLHVAQSAPRAPYLPLLSKW